MVSHQVCCKNYAIIICLLVLLPTTVLGNSTCGDEGRQQHDKHEALKFKLIAIATILVAGGIGVSLPQLGKKVSALNPENDIFFMIKAFAAGVILATGFVHILPEAFSTLTSPCIQNTWRKFPFAGFVAMMSSIGTLIVDTVAAGYYRRSHFEKDKQAIVDEEMVQDNEQEGHVHVHTHSSQGHAHGSALLSQDEQRKLSDLTRHRIISQVLELGIIVHSIIIGVTLGASESPDTIKTLLAALSFHQFFEGLGLGGCISQVTLSLYLLPELVYLVIYITLTGLYKEAGRKVMHPYSLLHIVCLYTSINAKAVPPKFLIEQESTTKRLKFEQDLSRTFVISEHARTN